MKKAWLLLIGKSKAETLSKMQTVSPPVTELKGLPGRMELGPFVLSTTIFGPARVGLRQIRIDTGLIPKHVFATEEILVGYRSGHGGSLVVALSRRDCNGTLLAS